MAIVSINWSDLANYLAIWVNISAATTALLKNVLTLVKEEEEPEYIMSLRTILLTKQ